MSDPRTAPYGAVRLADVETLEQVVGGPAGVLYSVSRWERALP
jgi:hypothetical protein